MEIYESIIDFFEIVPLTSSATFVDMVNYLISIGVSVFIVAFLIFLKILRATVTKPDANKAQSIALPVIVVIIVETMLIISVTPVVTAVIPELVVIKTLSFHRFFIVYLTSFPLSLTILSIPQNCFARPPKRP